jgi:hypothetical protein
MRRRNLLVAVSVALVWSGSAAAQTTSPGNPANPAANPANPANPTVSRNRVRVAAADVQGQGNRRDCTQLRGLDKSECERRDTARDDLPAGVTATQKERKR